MEWMVLLNILLGGGLLAVIVKYFFERKKLKADTEGVQETAKSTRIANEQSQLENLAKKGKIVKELLEDAEQSAEKARSLAKVISETQAENSNLKLEIFGQKKVIDYQREERGEWMHMLQTAFDANAKRDVEIAELKKVQAEHTQQIRECAERDLEKAQKISDLVEVLKKNKVDLPQEFHGEFTMVEHK